MKNLSKEDVLRIAFATVATAAVVAGVTIAVIQTKKAIEAAKKAEAEGTETPEPKEEETIAEKIEEKAEAIGEEAKVILEKAEDKAEEVYEDVKDAAKEEAQVVIDKAEDLLEKVDEILR